MSTQNLLIELFVEELPPKALKRIGEAFADAIYHSLATQGFIEENDSLPQGLRQPWAWFASPRRLAVLVHDVRVRAPDRTVRQKLMPVSIGIGMDGQPTAALLKKMQTFGVELSALQQLVLQIRSTSIQQLRDQLDAFQSATLSRQVDGKAEALFYDSTVKGAALVDGLQKALLESIAKLPIPKVMTYQLADGWTSVNFVRPVHRIVALHGASVLPIKALGLEASNLTEGHRFESSGEAFAIRDADSYESQMLEQGAVIAGFDARRAEIVRQLAAAAAKVGGGVKPIDDDALLDEVTALVERPNVLTCAFEKEFLEVPQECLILTMKANQKYFPLLDASGKLTHQFLVVSNIRPADASAVIGGNERVVRPRLADAKFFFDQDRKKTLKSRVAGLSKVVYHNKLGTQGERMLRVRKIAEAIANKVAPGLVSDVQFAAEYAKADLLTDMVGEFPELQGIMGRYYALHDGLNEGIAFAIEDHYKPRFAGDELPRNQIGFIVAIADKLETLVGMFGIGNLPTGDKDPFALRRHALGVVRMLIEEKIPLELDALIKAAVLVFGSLIKDPSIELQEFFYDRLRQYFRDADRGIASSDGISQPLAYTTSEIEAVLALKPQYLAEIEPRIQAVMAFSSLPEAPALAAANKRIGNILKKAPEADAHVSEVLLAEAAEKTLFDVMQRIAPEAKAQFDAGDYTASLRTLAVLRGPVDAFFDDVMVNVESVDVRLNRLGLLATLHAAMNRVADLSRLAS